MKHLIMQPPVTYSFLGSHILLSTLFSNTLVKLQLARENRSVHVNYLRWD